MTRYWLAGAAAFAMMTGVALAQGMSSETTNSTSSTTTTIAPIVGTYSSTSTQRTIDSNGNAVDESRSYETGTGGSSSSSSSQTISPDGSQLNSVQVEKSVTPDGGSTVSKKTTTTTDR
jgi:hypothetical protein